jgi:hypothetical protein
MSKLKTSIYIECYLISYFLRYKKKVQMDPSRCQQSGNVQIYHSVSFEQILLSKDVWTKKISVTVL